MVLIPAAYPRRKTHFAAYSTPVKSITDNGEVLSSQTFNPPGSVFDLGNFMLPDHLQVIDNPRQHTRDYRYTEGYRDKPREVVITVEAPPHQAAARGNSEVFNAEASGEGSSYPVTYDRAVYNDGERLSVVSGPTLKAIQAFNHQIQATQAANQAIMEAGGIPQQKVPDPLNIKGLRRFDRTV